MPAQRSASGGSKARGSRASKPSSAKSSSSAARSRKDGLANFAEQLLNRVIKPLDLVVISRQRIQETLDEAAERGRVTRRDANELVAELVKRGRQQTDDLFRDLESLLGRGRGQLGSATKQSVDRIVRGARRSIGAGPSFPISGYDDLSAGQVDQRLSGLTPAELRRVRDYERRHANRKTVLDAIERALS
jgi:polyhydroxyalkanoate synthesis regulator phasin